MFILQLSQFTCFMSLIILWGPHHICCQQSPSKPIEAISLNTLPTFWSIFFLVNVSFLRWDEQESSQHVRMCILTKLPILFFFLFLIMANNHFAFLPAENSIWCFQRATCKNFKSSFIHQNRVCYCEYFTGWFFFLINYLVFSHLS